MTMPPEPKIGFISWVWSGSGLVWVCSGSVLDRLVLIRPSLGLVEFWSTSRLVWFNSGLILVWSDFWSGLVLAPIRPDLD